MIKKEKTTNIYDIAKKAGVSIACVSKYLNNKPYVSKKTALKIKQAIKYFNYKPSAIARSLTTRKTKNIGLLIRDITNPFYNGIVRGIENYIKQNDLSYYLFLVDLANNDEDTDKYIESFLENRVSGIITTTDKLSLKTINNIKGVNLPIVFVSRYIDYDNYNLDFVITDVFKGAYILTNHIIKCGHKNIGFICGPLNSKTLIDRENGFLKALKDSNIDFDSKKKIVLDDYTIKSGSDAAQILMSSNNKPTAVFCINDFMAIGFINWCLKNNIPIPEEISVAGFDDILLSSLIAIGLTTIRQNIKFMGNKSAEILFNKINNRDNEVNRIILVPEIIIRKSIKCINIKNNS